MADPAKQRFDDIEPWTHKLRRIGPCTNSNVPAGGFVYVAGETSDGPRVGPAHSLDGLVRSVAIRPKRTPLQRTAQTIGKRPPLTHREDAGFWPRMVFYRCYVAGSEDCGMRYRLQPVVDRNEALRVQAQS